ncbi:MAG TPA: hypothetical protein VG268_14700 [Streptosporangiaceae bacterium]|nr:hypothetical protein [Streptosporangiaceae bacterium]
MTTFVALGDSITLGIGDRGRSQAWRGWAALLAEGLREPRLHNLAASGPSPPTWNGTSCPGPWSCARTSPA